VAVRCGASPDTVADVRVLFSFVGGTGHGEPLVPFAAAAAAKGHDVAFACRPAAASSVVDAGFVVFPVGTWNGQYARTPLVAPDAEHEDNVFRDWYANRLARQRVAAILEIGGTWRPDVIVCDEADFGCVVAAERLGVPHAIVLVIASGAFARRELIADSLNEVRVDHGLPLDPSLQMLDRHLVVSPFPPSFRDPRFPLPPTAHSVRPAVLEATVPRQLPIWINDLDRRPTVYFTLGTEFNLESGDLFTRVVAGLRQLPINLVVTVGRGIDPTELGPQPANVHVEQFIPQAALLPHCDLVVSHAGSGSVIGALAYGLPSVLLPMGADQLHNAARCEALGVGRTLDVMPMTSNDVRDTAASLLADTDTRRRAEQLRDEARALPGAGSVVARLEQLT
jgi:UDP:flavonoid glycosyltransferase YjiC (YdhE family)